MTDDICVLWYGVVLTDHSDSVGNVDERQPDDILTDRESNDEHSITEASHAAEHRLQIPPLPAADLNHLRRLATFCWLTGFVADTARPLQLARCGFFYVSGLDRIRCFFCGVELPLQDGRESSVLETHRVLSPNCTLDGDGDRAADALLRDILSWASVSVEVRQDGFSLQDLAVVLR